MNTPDLINGAFEAGAGLMQWTNVRRLLRDRQVKGVNWQVTAVFMLWGFWNLAYYPGLGQWASFSGGLVIVAANMVWVALAIRLRGAAENEAIIARRLLMAGVISPNQTRLDREISPHCDALVLHMPGTCTICDEEPTRQLQRMRDRVNFTGWRLPGFAACPAEQRRSLETINAWAGNVPRPAK